MLEKALGHAPPGYEIQSIYNLLGKLPSTISTRQRTYMTNSPVTE